MNTNGGTRRITSRGVARWLPVALTVALTGPLAFAAVPLAAEPVHGATPGSATFVPVGPLRLADTRRANCDCTRVDGKTTVIDVTTRPAVPDDAIAVAVTVTAIPTEGPGHVTTYPAGTTLPNTSTLNTRPDRVVSNSAIVRLGAGGRLSVFNLLGGDVIVDLTGVFVPVQASRAGRFMPMTPSRIVDTRTRVAPSGPLPPRGQLHVPLPAGVPSDASALVINVTSVLELGPGHLSARPSRAARRETSFLNVDGSGTAVAAAIIVPVDSGGLVIDSHQGGHLVVDVLGWFTGPSAPESSDGLFVPFGPHRALDTRRQPGRVYAGGTVEVASPIAGAAALATNVTVVQPDRRGHVTAFPARVAPPTTSTINPTHWNHTVANFAITTTSTAGAAYRSFAGTDLVVDVVGWFTGTPRATTTGRAPNVPSRSRVLLVGDSTLAAMDLFNDSKRALVGFDWVVDAKSCRRLMRPSCLSAVTGVIPNTAVEAIRTTPGRVDIVVMKTGYNDWFSDFPAEFHAVVDAARRKGAHTVLWLTYNVDVRPNRPQARLAYTENNADLRRLVTLPQYPDVLLGDWLAYSRPRQMEWFWDGTHMTREGSWAQAEYVSRWIAAIEHRPCPGSTTDVPCPAPP